MFISVTFLTYKFCVHGRLSVLKDIPAFMQIGTIGNASDDHIFQITVNAKSNKDYWYL